ncbi:MAG: FecR family protein [Deltaproteobacteria bacterium]|nr:FecR family protein [Deltaproteobacteria bacterium]
MKNTRLISILLLIAVFLPAVAFADVIGKITAIEGNVDVLKPGQERAAPAALQQLVSEGDILRTKSNGKAEITFIDESIIRLAPGSRLQITEYLMDGGKRKSGVMNLFRGKIRAVVSKSRGFIGAAFGGGARFEVRTPTAVAGVKGTDFFVSYSMGVTGILVKDGMVDVFNPAIPGQIVRVTEGNGTFIAGDKPPSSPRPASNVEMVLLTRDTDTFGYEAPGGTPAPPTDTVGTIVIPISETHTELLKDTIPPVVSIVSRSAVPLAAATADININFGSNETSTYSYQLDGGTLTSTGSSLSLTGVVEGIHTIDYTATDTAGNPSAPASLLFDLSRYSLAGNASDTATFTGTVTSGEVAGILNETWGGWSITMDGSYQFVGPSIALSAGGRGNDSLASNNSSYWIETIAMTASSGSLSGSSDLRYLSFDRIGRGTGTVSGAYGSGIWNITDSGTGTYTETPLAWSGNIAADSNSAGLYSLDTCLGCGLLDIEGNSTGIMGGVGSPWSGTTSATYMGTYDVLNGIGVGPPYLWTPEISSFNVNNNTNTTFDNGAYRGFIGGVWKADTAIDANVYSLYIDPAGNAGILKGDLTGAYYPSINMFSADGTWTPTALTTGLNATTATFNVISTNYGLTSPGSGTFNGRLGAITVAGNAVLPATDWRYSIASQDWGIWKSIIGGNYVGPTSDVWRLSTVVNPFSPITIYGTQTDGGLWSNNQLAGITYGYGADIATTPMTWISVGETIGAFNPADLVWQAVQMGAWLDTIKFLTMAGKIGTTPDTATLAALNIPFAEVGRANLSGTGTIGGSTATAAMNNVIFFAYNTGAAPKIWATGDINGTYTCSACGGGTIPVAGNGLSANLNVQTFDTAGQKWLATVNGSGTCSGCGTMDGTNVIMEGAAAGTNSGTVGGTFSGTGAGVVK